MSPGRARAGRRRGPPPPPARRRPSSGRPWCRSSPGRRCRWWRGRPSRRARRSSLPARRGTGHGRTRRPRWPWPASGTHAATTGVRVACLLLSLFGVLEVWGQPARLRHLPAGFRARTGLSQCESELIPSLGVFGREAHCVAEARDGAGQVALGELAPARAHRERGGLSVGLLLVEALGLGEGRRRARPVAALLQDLADAQVRLRGIVPLDGKAE